MAIEVELLKKLFIIDKKKKILFLYVSFIIYIGIYICIHV